MSKVAHLTADNYREFLDSAGSTPVLVDFGAEWCGPCRMLAPVIEKIAEHYQGKLLVAKVDVEESPEIAEEVGVSSLPRLVLSRGGMLLWDFTGALPEQGIKNTLDRVLG